MIVGLDRRHLCIRQSTARRIAGRIDGRGRRAVSNASIEVKAHTHLGADAVPQLGRQACGQQRGERDRVGGDPGRRRSLLGLEHGVDLGDRGVKRAVGDGKARRDGEAGGRSDGRDHRTDTAVPQPSGPWGLEGRGPASLLVAELPPELGLKVDHRGAALSINDEVAVKRWVGWGSVVVRPSRPMHPPPIL